MVGENPQKPGYILNRRGINELLVTSGASPWQAAPFGRGTGWRGGGWLAYRYRVFRRRRSTIIRMAIIRPDQHCLTVIP